MTEAVGNFRPKPKTQGCIKRVATSHKNAELVLVIGWNESIGAILLKMDFVVSQGSRVIVYSPKPEADRVDFLDNAQRRRSHNYANLTIEHKTGELGARFELEELPLEKASKMLILADDSAASSREAD